MAGDERACGRHADEDRALPGADRRARLLAERGVGLVADDDRVGVRDVAGVADEPLVGLDRHRPDLFGLLVATEQGGRDALLVAAVEQLAVELVHEVAAVGEDQDAACARRLHEAQRGHGLAGAGGVLEPEAAGRVGIFEELVRGALLLALLVDVPVERLLVGVDVLVALDLLLAGGKLLELRAPTIAVAVAEGALGLREQRDQGARQRVHLVGGERGLVGQVGLLLGQKALQPEQQGELAAPLH